MSNRSRTRSFFVMLFALILFSCDRGSSWTGKPAPDVTFKTLKGQQLELRSLDKPVLVSFWSTSCGVCIAEMPDLIELYEDYAADGFELVAVAMPSDQPNRVLQMATEKALPYPVAIDLDGAVLAEFEPIRGTPTSFLISADGTVLNRHVGKMNIKKLRATLDDLFG